jgi:hypothetical protein
MSTHFQNFKCNKQHFVATSCHGFEQVDGHNAGNFAFLTLQLRGFPFPTCVETMAKMQGHSLNKVAGNFHLFALCGVN